VYTDHKNKSRIYKTQLFAVYFYLCDWCMKLHASYYYGIQNHEVFSDENKLIH